MKSPVVSIIIPAYNSEKFIAGTINSALNQTWADKEIIIIDDGSTDQTLAIARQFESAVVKILTQNNKGASAARNYGLTIARGDYIQFLDADDLLSADKIEQQVRCLNGSVSHLASCRTIYFNNEQDFTTGVPSDSWLNVDFDNPVDFLVKLNAGPEVMTGYAGMVQPNAWLTPRRLIDEAGWWNEFRCPDDDGEFFCRIILASKGIKYSANGINYYRKFPVGKSLSSQKNRESVENLYLAIKLKHSYLKKRIDANLADRIFARHYWELGVKVYPRFKDLSSQLINEAKELGYNGIKYKSGKFATVLSHILGWRVARTLSDFKHGF